MGDTDVHEMANSGIACGRQRVTTGLQIDGLELVGFARVRVAFADKVKKGVAAVNVALVGFGAKSVTYMDLAARRELEFRPRADYAADAMTV